MEKALFGLAGIGLVIILVASLSTTGVPSGQFVLSGSQCTSGEVKDVKQVDGAYGVKLVEYTLCVDGVWTGPHTGTSLPK